MKTVSGKVVSSQQISLSKAAKLLSRFTASDNEATAAYAAYLRRTSTAFDELVQLHKEYKIPVGKIKTKKDHSSLGVVTDGTADSVKIAEGGYGVEGGKRDRVNEVGLNIEKDSRKVRDKVEEVCNKNVPDVRGILKKSKKKKVIDGDVVVTVNNQSSVERDAIKVNDVENEIGSLHGSVEIKENVIDLGGVLKKSKKKKGIDGDVVVTVNNQSSVERDAIKVTDVENEIGSLHVSVEIKENVVDLGGVLKKSKKKKGSDGDVAIAVNNQSSVERDAIKVNDVENEIGSLHGSVEIKENVVDLGGVLKKSKKKKRSDGDVAIAVNYQSIVEHDAVKVNDVEKEIGVLHGSVEIKENVIDLGGVLKKSKKKKGSDGDVAITVNNQPSVEHDAIKVNDVEEEVGTLHGSEEVKNNVTDGGEQKKHKSKGKEVKGSNYVGNCEQMDDNDGRDEVKEERGNCSIRNVEQSLESKLKNKHDVSDGKKHKKKRSHVAEEKQNEPNIETEVADKKASRKRKHERVADGEVGGSQEAIISKKKKI